MTQYRSCFSLFIVLRIQKDLSVQNILLKKLYFSLIIFPLPFSLLFLKFLLFRYWSDAIFIGVTLNLQIKLGGIDTFIWQIFSVCKKCISVLSIEFKILHILHIFNNLTVSNFSFVSCHFEIESFVLFSSQLLLHVGKQSFYLHFLTSLLNSLISNSFS